MTFTGKQIQIIDAAEKLFASKGFEGTSVRDIAEEAGINIAMISYYFGSKEGLMQGLFQQRTGDVVLKVEALLKDDSLSPVQKIEVLIDDYIDRIVTKHRFHKIMVSEQMLEKNKVITGLLNGLKKRNAEVIEKLIKDGQKKGVFKKKVDVVLMINTIIGTATQTFINRDYYRFYHGLEATNEAVFNTQLKKKLSDHIKALFKTILQQEA